MVEGGGCASFTPETFQSMRITGNVVGQELQGDEAAKLSVLGLVAYSHPAAAEFLDNAVVRNALADHWAGVLGLVAGQVHECRALRCLLGRKLVKNRVG